MKAEISSLYFESIIPPLPCATDGTKAMVKSVCKTVPKSLFWAPTCVPGFVSRIIVLIKMPLLICQSGWREIQNAFPIIYCVCWGPGKKMLAQLCKRHQLGLDYAFSTIC